MHKSSRVPLHTFVSFLLCMYRYVVNLVDIDECLSSPCDHSCTNTPGSFVCSCNDGHVLDDDGNTCNGVFIDI